MDQAYYLPDDILYKTDRMSMAHSLEVRPPFLDHRIVEFAASLPQSMKIRGFTQKFILKELMRGRLPETVLNRKKTGFDIPAHDWFRGVLRPLLMDTLTPQAIAATGIFDARAIQSLIRDHMERRINAGFHLWGLLTLFLWMKRWKVEVVPPLEALHRRGSSVRHPIGSAEDRLRKWPSRPTPSDTRSCGEAIHARSTDRRYQIIVALVAA